MWCLCCRRADKTHKLQPIIKLDFYKTCSLNHIGVFRFFLRHNQTDSVGSSRISLPVFYLYFLFWFLFLGSNGESIRIHGLLMEAIKGKAVQLEKLADNASPDNYAQLIWCNYSGLTDRSGDWMHLYLLPLFVSRVCGVRCVATSTHRWDSPRSSTIAAAF